MQLMRKIAQVASALQGDASWKGEKDKEIVSLLDELIYDANTLKLGTLEAMRYEDDLLIFARKQGFWGGRGARTKLTVKGFYELSKLIALLAYSYNILDVPTKCQVLDMLRAKTSSKRRARSHLHALEPILHMNKIDVRTALAIHGFIYTLMYKDYLDTLAAFAADEWLAKAVLYGEAVLAPCGNKKKSPNGLYFD